jgi:hypothetical protein
LVKVNWTDDCRFGLVRLKGDPDDPTDIRENVRLTYSSSGGTNNTLVWVDGETPRFGDRPAGQLIRAPQKGRDDTRLRWLWHYKGVEVGQDVELVPGDVSRRMDTVKVTYTLHNRDEKRHEVGLRAMIDTLIGENDGVPFIAPGTAPGLIKEAFAFGIGRDFAPGPTTGKIARPFVYGVHPEIPPFVRALEGDKDKPGVVNIDKPGVVVNIGGLRPKGGESPTYVALSHWPGGDAVWDYQWDAPFRTDPNNPNDKGDSAIGLYYQPRPLGPDEKRTVQFTYGLGLQTRRKNLTLTAGTAPQAGGEFYLVALVQSPELNQTATIELPEGLSLVDDPKTQPVKVDGTYTQVSWRVKVGRDVRGKHQAKVRLESGGQKRDEAPAEFTVAPPDSRLDLRLAADKLPASQRSFYVAAYVLDPSPGQTVELDLGGATGLTLHADYAARQPVPHPPDQGRYGRVLWLVEAGSSARGDPKLTATMQPGDVRQDVTIKVEPRTLTD